MLSDQSHLFVSHVAEDAATAQEIVADLERRGLRCWIAPRDIHPGKPYDDEIAEAIDSCRAMLLIFSARCNDNDYIRREVTMAGEARKLIIPLRIEDAQPQRGLRVRLSDLHWIDAFPDRGPAIEAIVKVAGSGLASAGTDQSNEATLDLLIKRATAARPESKPEPAPIKFDELTFSIWSIVKESIKYAIAVAFCALMAIGLEGYIWLRLALGAAAVLFAIPILFGLKQLTKRKPREPLVVGSDFVEFRGKRIDRNLMTNVTHKVLKGLDKGTTVDTLLIDTPAGTIDIGLNEYFGNYTPYKNAVAEHVKDMAEGKGDLSRLLHVLANSPMPTSG